MSEFKLTVNKKKKNSNNIFKTFFINNEKYTANYNGYQYFIAPRVKGFWNRIKNKDIAFVYVWGNSASAECNEKNLKEVQELFNKFLVYLQDVYTLNEVNEDFNIEIEVTDDL